MSAASNWLKIDARTGDTPPGIVEVGDDVNGDEMYVGRAKHDGDLLPAKYIPLKKRAYVAYGGKEYEKDHVEVLIPAQFGWKKARGGAVPKNAVGIGETTDGESLFYGRVEHDGIITPGKIHPSHNVCYYPFDGKELQTSDYECLVYE